MILSLFLVIFDLFACSYTLSCIFPLVFFQWLIISPSFFFIGWQITRGNATVKARLAQLLTEKSSSNPRWLIKFDGLSLKDEEVYEHTFAKSSSPSSDNSDSGLEGYSSLRSSGGGGGRNTRNSRHYGGTSSDNETGDDRRRRHYGVSSNLPSDESETGGESSRTRARRLASAREARSKRRQAKIDEEAVSSTGVTTTHNKRRLPPPPPPDHHSRNKGKRARNNYRNTITNNRNGQQNNDNGDDGEVVKVNLLTGTLYLYRGLHRRAEFVRKV